MPRAFDCHPWTIIWITIGIALWTTITVFWLLGVFAERTKVHDLSWAAPSCGGLHVGPQEMGYRVHRERPNPVHCATVVICGLSMTYIAPPMRLPFDLAVVYSQRVKFSAYFSGRHQGDWTLYSVAARSRRETPRAANLRHYTFPSA